MATIGGQRGGRRKVNLNIAYLFILITPLSPLEDFHNRFVLLPRAQSALSDAHVLRLFMFRLCKFGKLCPARVGLSSDCDVSFRLFPLLSIIIIISFFSFFFSKLSVEQSFENFIYLVPWKRKIVTLSVS